MGNHCITQEKEYIDLAGNKFNSDGHASYRKSVLSAGYVEDHATRVLVARGRELYDKKKENPESENNINSRNSHATQMHLSMKLRSIDSDALLSKHKIYKKSTAASFALRLALENSFSSSNLDPNSIDQLISYACPRSENVGNPIVTQGDMGKDVFILYDGHCDVVIDGVVVSEISAPAVFGELSLLYSIHRMATVVPTSKCQIYNIPGDIYKMLVFSKQIENKADIINILCQTEIFYGCSEKLYALLAQHVETIAVKKDRKIFSKGSAGNIFYIIVKGSVIVSDIGAYGSFGDVVLNAGDYFGERSLVSSEPRLADVTTTEDCTLLYIGREVFRSAMGECAEIVEKNLNVRILESIKLFDHIPNFQKKKLCDLFVVEKFVKGSKIIKEGEIGDKFYIMKEGRARVQKSGITVGELVGGQYFGENALFDSIPRVASITASKDVECFVLKKEEFDVGMQEDLKRAVESNPRLTTASELEIQELQPQSWSEDDFQRVGLLRYSHFGENSVVFHKESGVHFICKDIVKNNIETDKQMAMIRQERDILKDCSSPLVQRIYRTFQGESMAYIIMELPPCGDLYQLLYDETTMNRGLPIEQVQFYSACVLGALSYLHKKGIIHRDLKPDCCMIDHLGYVKLTDLGFAKCITPGQTTTTLCGTAEYMSPEMILGRGYNECIDIWAFGILLYELLVGHTPFRDKCREHLVILRNIVCCVLSFPSTLTSTKSGFEGKWRALLRQLIVKNPATRLGCGEAGIDVMKNDPFYKGIAFDLLSAQKLQAPWIPPLGELNHTMEDTQTGGIALAKCMPASANYWEDWDDGE